MSFIIHPTYAEQQHEIESILSKLSIETIDKVLEPLGLRCMKFERLQTSGRINFLYNLQTQLILQSNVTCDNEFILKISNPHRYWRHYRTQNEVYTMQHLYEHTTIPLPKILAYSCDSQTSILECEFILMEKIHGNTLEHVIDQMSDDSLMKTATEMIDYVKQLHEINLPQMNQIGSFCSKTLHLGGYVLDGPTLGPFHTPKEFILAHLQWSIQSIEIDSQLFEIAKHLLSPLQEIIKDIENDEYLSNMKYTFHMTHTDLNTSNIIVDEITGKILAIIDWESCAMTFDESDMKFYAHWSDNEERKEEIKSLLPSNWVNESSNDITYIKPYLDVMYSAMWTTFYSSTWFESEQQVLEHIKYFVQDTEKVITKLNKVSS
ncbi:unnamed protein product [Rotaria sp. Silwood1]|nr:unnamed protein product [Rotaria sp. Silwood1]CAF3700898.1 unnamed protein product [Rotaria sp. Silwood1]CAF3833443.1 unnamed protein product [Rotaria sp. Silwood1]CAF4984115.1 unnamed protein product [Rotaria sp. Silwood1]CAF4993396.1 unnamed protein product [Rotaria sp. Silwood1]